MALVSVIFLYAQQFEKVTYVEIFSNGTYSKPKTVEAVHVGYLQRHFIMESNYLVVYQCGRILDFNTDSWSDWSEWELTGKQPVYFSIRQFHDRSQIEYEAHPNSGEIIPMGNGSYSLIMPYIPAGKSSPYWWGNDGKSIYGFYIVYIFKL